MANRAQEWWQGLGRNNQIMIVAGSLGSLLALIAFISWAGTPEYVPLFNNLSAQDANTIVDKLKEAKVPYELTSGGTGVEVPAQNRDEMRMQLASAGLPTQSSATLGYELLDKVSSIGTTQPVEAMTILRAKEGEIAKSIMSLQQVAAATVQIAAPEETAFVTAPGERKDAKASIMVALKPGQSLTEENVRAIIRLTQMAYTGLTEKSVSLVDSAGNLLFDPDHTGTMEGDDRIKQAHAIEKAEELKLQTMLDNTIGPHKAVVAVHAELNANAVDVSKTTVEPGVVTSKTSETEELNGKGSVPRGAAGAAANVGAAGNPSLATGAGIPTYQSLSSGDDNGSYKHDTSSVTSQPSVTTTHTVEGEGQIQRLTVSTIVDSKVPSDQVASIKSILEGAIGFVPNDPTMSRLVTVAQVPFDVPKTDVAVSSSEAMNRAFSVAVPLVLMFICFFMLARSLRKPVPVIAGGRQLALAGGMGGSSFSMEGGMPIALDADGVPIPGQKVGSAVVSYNGDNSDPVGVSTGSGSPKTYDVIEEAFDAHLESILHLTRSKPETVAILIKSWLSEEM